jgi:hypothetical protein
MIGFRMKARTIGAIVFGMCFPIFTALAQNVAPKTYTSKNLTLGKSNETVYFNGKTWDQSQLRAVWVSDKKAEQHTQNRATQTHAQSSQAVPKSRSCHNR